MTRTVHLLTAVILSLSGCVVSPQPTPPGERPVLDPGHLVTSEGITELFVAISGTSGSVTPPEGDVIATDLETMAEPTVVPVEADGSFTIGVTTLGTDEIRLQVRGATARSEPLDLLWGAGGFSAPRRPRALCLFVDPTHLPLAPGGPGAITVRSTCVDRVSLRAPRLRRGSLGFAISDASPFDLREGESRTLTVSAPASAPAEDVLFVETLDDPSDRRPITLHVDR